MISKAEIKKISQIKGKVRGSVFKTDYKYIEKHKGEAGTRKLQKEIKKLEPEFDYEKFSNIKWYPLHWRILSLLVIKDIFAFEEEDLFKMGREAPKNSFIARTLLKYFVSWQQSAQEVGKYWGKHYSVGQVKSKSAKNKQVVVEIRNFNLHPILCHYYRGYFYAIAELTTKGENIQAKETKCGFRGDNYHEFTINWD